MTFEVAIRSAVGLRKISLTHEFQASLGFSRGEAKAMTDRMLEGETVRVGRPSRELAELFAARVSALGAVTDVREQAD